MDSTFVRRCYMPCDTTLCPSVKRSSSVYLWRAALNNVSLCYSYENCGSVDTDHSQQLACLAECEKTKQHHECLCECQNHGCNVCGDGKLDKGHSVEGCDDGNTEDGDGCDGACTIEEGYTCTAEEDQLSKCTTESDDEALQKQVSAATALSAGISAGILAIIG